MKKLRLLFAVTFATLGLAACTSPLAPNGDGNQDDAACVASAAGCLVKPVGSN